MPNDEMFRRGFMCKGVYVEEQKKSRSSVTNHPTEKKKKIPVGLFSLGRTARAWSDPIN